MSDSSPQLKTSTPAKTSLPSENFTTGKQEMTEEGLQLDVLLCGEMQVGRQPEKQ